MPDVQLFAMTCGWLDMPLGLLRAEAPGRITVPVPSFLVRHPRGVVVFDTGLHRDTQDAACDRLGPLAKIFRVRFSPGEEVAARLAALAVDPAAVQWLVTSHLHFDHVGGNAQLPNARWVVQRREWEAGRDPEQRARLAYDARDFDLGHDKVLVDGEHDLFGDGSVTCLPTFGHTPGHQSLRVRNGGREIVLAADACSLRRTLEDGVLPPQAHDPEQMRASLARLRALRERGAQIIVGHDPEQWADVAQAPAALLGAPPTATGPRTRPP